MPQRSFYREQILANCDVLFPAHAPCRLITLSETKGLSKRISVISSTTGEVLLRRGGTSVEGFGWLIDTTEQLLGARDPPYSLPPPPKHEKGYPAHNPQAEELSKMRTEIQDLTRQLERLRLEVGMEAERLREMKERERREIKERERRERNRAVELPGGF